MIVSVRLGVVSGVTAAVSGRDGCALGAGCGVAGCGVFAFAARFAFASGAGRCGAKKYDQPKSTAIERTAAIRKRD